jgi:hypothetical protein
MVPLASSLTGCVVGPASIAAGRGVYNEVINRTEDEQLLNMIVHERYNETYGMLGVASVTASIRARATVGAQFGLSRTVKEDYTGNLVPLAGGVAYEENPTISYTPLGGAKFVQRFLSPLSMEETLLMGQYVRHWRRSYITIGIRSINGIRNPRLTEDDADSAKFDRLVHLWRHLRLAGVLGIARAPSGELEAIFHTDDSEDEKVLEELLELTRISKRPSGGRLVLPVRVAAEGWSEASLIFETASVLGILRAAGACIEIPEPHIEAGVVQPSENSIEDRFLRIRTSRTRPDGEGTVAIRYRGWWYYVDDTDPDSKRAFLFLRVLVGLRLHKTGEDQLAPVLTIPVG